MENEQDRNVSFYLPKAPLLELLLELQAMLLAHPFLRTEAHATGSVLCCLQADHNTVPLSQGSTKTPPNVRSPGIPSWSQVL